MLADLFNSFEKLRTSLADERVAKLSAKSTNVVTERGIEFGGSVRHLGTVAGTARGQAWVSPVSDRAVDHLR